MTTSTSPGNLVTTKLASLPTYGVSHIETADRILFIRPTGGDYSVSAQVVIDALATQSDVQTVQTLLGDANTQAQAALKSYNLALNASNTATKQAALALASAQNALTYSKQANTSVTQANNVLTQVSGSVSAAKTSADDAAASASAANTSELNSAQYEQSASDSAASAASSASNAASDAATVANDLAQVQSIAAGITEPAASTIPYSATIDNVAITDVAEALNELNAAPTGLTPGNFGSASQTLTISVNYRGRVNGIKATSIAITGSQVSYNNATSGLTATDVQAAIDEVSTEIGTAQSQINTLNTEVAGLLTPTGVTSGNYGSSSDLVAITVNNLGAITSIANIALNPPATAVSYDNASSGLGATNVQSAIDDLDSQISTATAVTGVTAGTYGSAAQSLTINVRTDGRLSSVAAQAIAIAATAVSYNNSTSGLTATDVQAAIDELESNIQTVSTAGLAPSGVTAGTYGSSTSVPVLNINTDGIVTGASNVTIAPQAINVSYNNTSSGLSDTNVQSAIDTLAADYAGVVSLTTTGVTTGTYGSAADSLTVAVNTYGQVTSIAAQAIAIAATAVSYSNSSSGLTATDVQSAIDELAANSTSLSASGVTAGTYGSATQVGQFTVNTDGIITAASSITITPAAASVTYDNSTSGLNATDVQTAIDDLAASGGSLSASGVTAGTYGSAADSLTVTVNTYGQVTSIAAQAIAIPATQVSYSNTTSGLTATDVQAAIDENAADVSTNTTNITTNTNNITSLQSSKLSVDGSIPMAGNLAMGGYQIQNYTEQAQSPAVSSGTWSVDCTAGSLAYVTLAANTTLAFSNVPASGNVFSLMLEITQNSTGGYTFTLPSSVLNASGISSGMTTTANTVSIISLYTRDGGTTWVGNLVATGL